MAAQLCADKRIPSTVSYSSQKCQNNAKEHPSYSSMFHSKLITNTKPTSIQQQQPPPPPGSTSSLQQQQQQQQKQINGSYTRLTNKLNCCKSCVRDADEALAKKCVNDVLLSKPKTQYTDSNLNGCYDRDQITKGKLFGDVRKPVSMAPSAMRRHSMDTNGLLRKSTLKQSFDDDLMHVGFRHQSFDDAMTNKVHQRLPKKLTPPQLEHQNDLHRNGTSNYLTQPAGKLTTLNDSRRMIKQKSLDDYTDATARLRKLEMKMRKHKVDVLKYANDHNQSNIYTEQKKLLGYPAAGPPLAVSLSSSSPSLPPNQLRNKLDPFARTKIDCIYPKIGVDSVMPPPTTTTAATNKNAAFRKANTNGSYGIITSTELYKLRGTPERVT